MDRAYQEAYQRSHELRLTLGNYQPSPYRPWSLEDMAWLAGADDASGDYPTAADEHAGASPSPQPKEPQLSLF
ncbi:hypothetical protein [Modicisalibacter xianhensis]|uniref:Uncharacterized protein n=1 Tax=Modicisalibacter xianhensis TaxID=442341 RepID=A0A1I3FQB6_9GAMM|nr:hypothetical protein [Halomonas xianhensis]SFI13400.1 hypothetical protein SAMN04487959_12035 [Halomonas xianhensis]